LPYHHRTGLKGFMKEFSEGKSVIRKYLLGNLPDETKMRQIEEKSLLDDRFDEEVSIAEDALIDDYLDGTLTGTERQRFTEFFLITKERREKLRLIENLRRYASETKPRTVKQSSEEKTAVFDWRSLFSYSAVRFALAALIVCGSGFAVWRIAFYQSDVDRGLDQLQIAYRGQRPVEVRIVGLDYAPLAVTRGAGDNETNPARQRAEALLLHAATENPTAETLYALGKFYLTEKRFKEANERFERAAELAPDNARLESDWGAALLEMGKRSLLEQNGAKGLEYLDRSLKHLERAIELDPKMPEPRFNRALNLQALGVPEQAKQAWREYLDFDPNSQWAEEAGRNLQILESQKPEDRSAAELERDFLIAARDKNEEKAWELLSRNRELIREKYLPQRLAMSFLEASGDEKKVFLEALEYAGELEKTRIGDSFAGEIARFYAALPESKTASLKKAQQAVRNGYKLSINSEYFKALDEFNNARDLFLQADDIWETKLSEYFIGYCLINIDRIDNSLEQFKQIAEFSRSRNYKWLEATSLHWLAGNYKSLKQRTQAKKNYEKALAIAEEIKDPYAAQRNLVELAKHNSFVGQKTSALNYLSRVLEASNAPETSLRQKYRNYAEALQILSDGKLYNAAKPISLESVWLADKLNDSMFKTLSRSNTGIAYAQAGDFIKAREWINDGREKAEMMSDELSRKRMTAYSYLASGYSEKQLGNYEKSEQFYEQAVKLYETMKMPFHLYVSQKGKLLNHLALGNGAELERQIPLTLKLIEDYRAKILEEQERASFLDTEESIYDIAVDYEFGNGKYEQAYNYTEISNSRSLLDWLQKGAKISGSRQKPEILLEDNATPLPLAEIRERMPGGAQILQYTVLENKVLIWLVSKEKFVVVPVEIKAEALQEKVEKYLELLQRKNAAQADAGHFGRELYDLLIKPIFNHLDPTLEVCLIPNKILFHLPFAALISRGGKPLLAEFDIFYAPSANVFLLCTENARKKAAAAEETLLSVGNPAFDRREFADLADLPEAEAEAREVAALYDKPEILVGRKATKSSFQNSIKNTAIIHFAGHYVVAHEAPMSSSLLLAKTGENLEDGVLTNSELISEKLPQAKLIVLSACQTGVERYNNSEGLIGLSRTFLAAGAPLIVGSQWKVDSGATAELMKRFHFYRRQENLSTTAALRRAQLEMYNAPNGRFREPYYWAAFSVFGGYASF
jgi:CHAT domain-containing protein